MRQKTALYRFFDANGQLLYVGVSLRAVGRMEKHSACKPWYGEVVRSMVEWHETRSDAFGAELVAIRTENPLYNVHCNTIPMKRKKHPDAALIAALGGPSELAKKLGYDPKQGGVQRVQNWTKRGIPPLLRYQRVDVFGPAPDTDDTKRVA